MTAAELLALFRSTTFDTATPYLWSDTEVYTFMDLAQQMFCREVIGISDSKTAAICELAVTAGDKWVDVAPEILKIRHAQRRSDAKPLKILNFEDMNQPSLMTDYNFQRELRLDDTTGPLSAFVVGMEPHSLRLVPVAADDDTIDLIVYRLPITIPATTPSPVPFEIDPQHHYYLLFWMQHLAYAKQDAETFDKAKSEQFRADFLAYCAQAKLEKDRTEHKYRTVAYGGI
jgi:hypothetical protein